MLRRAKGSRSMLETALDAVWAEINRPDDEAAPAGPSRATRESRAS